MSAINQVHPFRNTTAALAALLWTGLVAVVPAALLADEQGHPIDGLTLAITILTLFVGATVASFSRRYMRADRRAPGYAMTLALLVAGVLVCVATWNIVVLALAWSVSGLAMAQLIGHDDARPEAVAAARRARLAYGLGDAALLAGLTILAGWAGSLQIATVLAKAGAMPAPLALTAALLLLAAASVRCALPPFSGWLLSSMTAPTPVSAAMHAGFVNAGGFLLLRFAPLFEAAPAARITAVVLGGIAAVHGLGIMMVRPDIKRSLAGSTVSQMGFMIMSCGLGAYAAALWHILAHGLFKAWLFLGAGSAVGIKIAPSQPHGDDPVPMIVAGAVLLGGLMLVPHHAASGMLVPLLLGVATAAAMLAGALRSALTTVARLSLAAGIVGLVVGHGLGLALATAASAPDATAIVPPWALFVLAGGFLGAWVWQEHRLTRGRPLPSRLYIHWLNAGALHATGGTK